MAILPIHKISLHANFNFVTSVTKSMELCLPYWVEIFWQTSEDTYASASVTKIMRVPTGKGIFVVPNQVAGAETITTAAFETNKKKGRNPNVVPAKASTTKYTNN